MPETLPPKIKDPETVRTLAEVVETLLGRRGLGRAEQRQLLGMENCAGACAGSPLPAFEGQTPLAVMLSHGTEGMRAVRTALESD